MVNVRLCFKRQTLWRRVKYPVIYRIAGGGLTLFQTKPRLKAGIDGNCFKNLAADVLRSYFN